jgi:exodeoxyribonuclease V
VRALIDHQQVVRLGGMAGVGKTTVVAEMARWPGVTMCTPTNKAASVLQGKVGLGIEVGTVHSLLYQPFVEINHQRECPHLAFTVAELLEALGKDREWQAARNRAAKVKIIQRYQPCHCPVEPAFMMRDGQVLGPGTIVVVDEASMLSGRLFRDLESTGANLILVGDYAQLPPVKDTFMALQERTLDVILRTIHRQAADNPIIKLAWEVRQAGRIPPGTKIWRVDEVRERVSEVGVPLMLCHTNKKRVALNAAARKALRRQKPVEVGERIICVSTNKEKQLYNGAVYTVVQLLRIDDETAYVRAVGDDGVEYSGRVNLEQLAAEKGFSELEQGPGDQFMYAYALTVHKAQGSEADRVRLYLDYKMLNGREEYARWLYTGITRAKEQLRLVEGRS